MRVAISRYTINEKIPQDPFEPRSTKKTKNTEKEKREREAHMKICVVVIWRGTSLAKGGRI